jgi:molybdopterin-binding protein
MAKSPKVPMYQVVRIGQAADLLGVSIDTLRRWEASGRLRVRRSAGGQRLVGLADIRGVLAERRRKRRPDSTQSARNRFPGVITRIEKDRVAAVVEVQAGPHRLVSLMTAEAATELALRPGANVICVVKATNVIVEIAQRGRGSS